ncbi:ABC transporter ATP-binding protein [Streptomyces violascens]|uniref:ABC transporter ATP-binding protein n=1 Tax=Streptomyces violascens TaxID=67381 RepID=UPI00365C8BE5
MSGADPARFDGFTKTFGGTTAVEDLSFALRPGRILGLLGANGAGKSTSLRGLLGLVRPSSGSATVFGVPYADLAHAARRVGVSMDGMGFISHLSGSANLRIAARAAGVERGRVAEVLDLVGLAPDAAGRRVKGYSTGMRQRLSIAAALLGDPELLVLDEPANGMDPDGIRWLRGLLRQLADEGRTVLVSSHQLAELEQTVDDVAILQRRLLFCGSLAELTDDGSRLEEKFFELTTAQVSGASVA